MKIFIKRFVVVTVLLFMSCTQTIQSSYVVTIVDHHWKKDDKYKLPITILESGTYHLSTIFRHNLKYPYTKFEGELLLIKKIKPDTLHFKIDINLVDSAGKWAGENLDDLMSCELPLHQKALLEKGTYQAVFSNNMMDADLKNVLNIGVKFKKEN